MLLCAPKAPKPESNSKMKIAKIREIIRSGYYLRDMLTGGTLEEFARQEVGPDLEKKIAEIEALIIPARFTADITEAAAEIDRCREVVERWKVRRAEYLDKLALDATGYPTFDALIQAPFGDGPKLNPRNDRQRFLAKHYDAAQEAREDARRAVLA